MSQPHHMFEGAKYYGGQNRAEQGGAGSLGGQASCHPKGDFCGGRHLGASVAGNGNSQGQRPKVGAVLECQGTEKEKSMTAEGLWGPEWRLP